MDLTVPENAFVWYKMRLIARQTGSRFSLRLQIYVTVMLVILLGLNIIFLFRFLAIGARESVSDFQSVLLVAEVAYMNTAVLSCTFMMIFYGAMANSQNSKQSEGLTRSLIKLEELSRLERYNSEVCQELRSSLQAIHTVKDAVRIDDTTEPIKIFGVTANPLIFRGFATGVATLVATIIGRALISS